MFFFTFFLLQSLNELGLLTQIDSRETQYIMQLFLPFLFRVFKGTELGSELENLLGGLLAFFLAVSLELFRLFEVTKF